jgi:hypothetical protein
VSDAGKFDGTAGSLESEGSRAHTSLELELSTCLDEIEATQSISDCFAGSIVADHRIPDARDMLCRHDHQQRLGGFTAWGVSLGCQALPKIESAF